MKPILLLLTAFISVSSFSQMTSTELLHRIRSEFGKHKAVFALAFRNIANGETLLLNEHESFHAASTMKTPVMIEVYKQAAAGRLSLADHVLVKNEFRSIVDSSTYQLNAADDSQQELYTKIGSHLPLSELVYQMIIMSSNLATNLIIELVDGKKITQTMRGLGANDMQVLRGVEDSKAYAQGLNNTTTAHDLMLVFEAMAKSSLVNAQASQDMIRILLDQKHNELIPARLPKHVKVAHKTGSITGVQHDSGIVFMPGGGKYVLVILSKKLEDVKAGVETIAAVSEMVYQYVGSQK